MLLRPLFINLVNIYFINLYAVNAVKVNMQGSLSLGEDVLHALNKFLIVKNSRRSLNYDSEANDDFRKIIKLENFCSKATFCDGTLATYLDDYVISIADSIRQILQDKKDNANDREVKQGYTDVYLINNLKECLKLINKALKEYSIVHEENKTWLWDDIFKKINGIFQFVFLKENNKLLSQKVVKNTAEIEFKDNIQICKIYKSCNNSNNYAETVIILLSNLNELSESKVREFIRSFHDELKLTPFLSTLDKVTADEFQTILEDMSFKELVKPKNILSMVLVSVNMQLKFINLKDYVDSSPDVQMIHTILSDMEHTFDKDVAENLLEFMKEFKDWTVSDDKLNDAFKKVMKGLTKHINSLPIILQEKLRNEVKVFFEITVD